MYRAWLFIVILLLSSVVIAQQAGSGLTRVKGKPQAPEFELLDIDGQKHQLSAYRGKVVIVNFWATWCPPCRAEMPSMQRAWLQLKTDNIVMLGVDVGEDEDTIFEFTANYPVEFPLLMDLDSTVTQQWPVIGLPTTFIIDSKGKIVYRAIGGREWDDPDLIQLIKAVE